MLDDILAGFMALLALLAILLGTCLVALGPSPASAADEPFAPKPEMVMSP